MGWFFLGDNVRKEKALKEAFSSIKKEFDDHLEAINENSNEIQTNYELLVKLETKIEKMESKLIEIDRFIRQFKSQNVYFLEEDEQDVFTITPLTDDEKKAFKVLYELDTQNIHATYQKISEILGVSSTITRDLILSLIEKGIPITKSYLNQVVHLSLEPKFRDLQTRKNIVDV